MRNLDIDACLMQNPDEEPFTVILKDEELFPEESPALRMKIRYVDFRKNFKTYYRTKMSASKRESKGMEVEIAGNDYEFGLKMVEYVIGWEGISGTFDRDKLRSFFERFPTVCESFGSAISGVFKIKDKHYLKYEETVEKN